MCVLLHRAAASVAMPMMIPQTHTHTEVYTYEGIWTCVCLFDFLLPASSSAYDCCYAKENYNMTAMVNSRYENSYETISVGERAWNTHIHPSLKSSEIRIFMIALYVWVFVWSNPITAWQRQRFKQLTATHHPNFQRSNNELRICESDKNVKRDDAEVAR